MNNSTNATPTKAAPQERLLDRMKENEVLLDLIYFGMHKDISIDTNIELLKTSKERYKNTYKNLRLCYKVDNQYNTVYAQLIAEKL